jgi:ribosome-associated translation inhibitor RaiA
MQIPVEIAFKGMPESDSLQAAARKHAAELEHFFDRITSCRVVVDASQGRQRKGNLYTARVDLTVPGAEIVASREHRLDHGHEDAYVAMRDAFAAARRQLEDYVRRMRGQVKTHASAGGGP